MTNQTIAMGVDLGSLGCRAAYVEASHIRCLREDSAVSDQTWLQACPDAGGGFGLNFLSLKESLAGEGSEQGSDTGAWATISKILSGAKKAVESKTAGPVDHLTLCVPALYSAHRRTTLRRMANQAGFRRVSLLNDAMAAAIAYAHERAGTVTLLVYQMGYLGFELALIRVVKGRYRALAYEAGASPGGRFFDELFLRAWLDSFSSANLRLEPPSPHGSNVTRYGLRRAAQDVKETLSRLPQAPFPVFYQTEGEPSPRSVTFSRDRFEQAIVPSMNTTLQLADRMLAEAHLEIAGLGAVLLVGGSCKIPKVCRMLERHFGEKIVTLPADAPARGAAIFSRQTSGNFDEPRGQEDPGSAIPISEDNPASVAMEATATSSLPEPSPDPQTMILKATPILAQATPAEEPDPTLFLDFVQALIDGGHTERARLLLKDLIGRVQLLQKTLLSSPIQSQTKRAQSKRAIDKAYRLLKKKRFAEAVPQSHLAWQSAPNDPLIFDQMIDVHCQAAHNKNTVADYLISRRWLECALGHDQSNTKVRLALADRHFSHAQQLAELGRGEEALSFLELCLQFNPEHREGEEFMTQLRH